MTPGDILRDDELRLVQVVSINPEQHLVVLRRMDRAPREHKLVTRHKAEVDHYPEVQV
jgi:hypothetical protein